MPQLGESVKREACAALYLRANSDVVPGAGRVLLAGEAGGFMSPSSGEGISYALRSGVEAGRAIGARAARGRARLVHLCRRIRLRSDTARRLRWLPLMESKAGKYLAGFVPTAIVSRVTQGL